MLLKKVLHSKITLSYTGCSIQPLHTNLLFFEFNTIHSDLYLNGGEMILGNHHALVVNKGMIVCAPYVVLVGLLFSPELKCKKN